MADDSTRKFFIGFAITLAVGVVPITAVLVTRPSQPAPQVAQQTPPKPVTPAPKPAAQPAPAPVASKPKPAEPESAPVAPKPIELAPVPNATPPVAPEPAPPAEPEPLKTVPAAYKLPDGITCGPQVKLGNLRVQALKRKGAPGTTDILTLREAMAAGYCRVTEHHSDGLVRVHNEGTSPVLVMPGELLLGGRKDRVVACCEIIEAGIVDRQIPVLPVEGQRKTEDAKAKPGEFYMDEAISMADLRTRNSAAAQVSRAALLKRAQNFNKRMGAEETASLRAGLKAANVQAGAKQLAALVDADTVGFVVQDKDGIIAIDCFESRALFAKYAESLARSYALAADDTAGGASRATASQADWEGTPEYTGYAK